MTTLAIKIGFDGQMSFFIELAPQLEICSVLLLSFTWVMNRRRRFTVCPISIIEYC